MTINDIVEKVKLHGTELDQPRQVSDYIDILTANLYHMGIEVTKSDVEYAKKWKEIRKDCKTDKEADETIKLEEIFMDRESKKHAYKTAVEVIRSLKKRLILLQDEMHNCV